MQSKRDDAVAEELRGIKKELAELSGSLSRYRAELLEFRQDIFSETWKIRDLLGEGRR